VDIRRIGSRLLKLTVDVAREGDCNCPKLVSPARGFWESICTIAHCGHQRVARIDDEASDKPVEVHMTAPWFLQAVVAIAYDE